MSKESYLNIEDYNCFSYQDLGEIDNASDLQNLIDSMGVTNSGIIYVPGKTYCIGETIQVNMQGFSMIGTGRASSGFDINNIDNDNQSRFVWIGDPNEPMFLLHGPGKYIDGVDFVGQIDAEGDRASIGLGLARDEGEGTGRIWISQFSASHCATGFHFSASGVNNCDQTTIQDAIIDNCDVGIGNGLIQSVDNRVQHATITNCDIGILIGGLPTGGGRFAVNNITFEPSVNTLIYCDDDNSNSLLKFSNVYVKPETTGILFYGTDDAGPTTILFDQLNYNGQERDSYRIYTSRSQLLIMRNCNNLVNSMIKSYGTNGFGNSVRLENCMFASGYAPSGIVDFGESSTHWNSVWYDCIDEYGNIFDNGVTGENLSYFYP